VDLRRKGAGVLGANWVGVVLGLVSSVVVVRLLGAEGRGTLVLLTTLVLILATLGQFGFLASGMYYLRKGIYGERTLIANYFVVIVVISTVCGASVLAGSGAFRRIFFEGASVSGGLVLLAICMLPLMMFANFVAALLLAKGQTRAYGSLTVIPAVAGLVLTLAFVAGVKWGVAGALLAMVLSRVLAALIGGIPMLRATRGQETELSRRTMSDLSRFGLKYYGVTLGFQIFKRGDNFLLAYFLDVQAVAYYSIGVNLYEVILSLPRAIGGLLAGEAAGGPEQKAGAMVARASRGVVWLMATGALVLGFASYWLIPPVYGADFDQARAPALILLASAVLLGFAFNLQNYFIGVGRPGIIAILALVAGAANLVLSIVLIPPAGIVGNALATLLGSALALALVLYWFRRLAGVPIRSTYLPPPSGLLDSARRGVPRLQEPGG
jgi:O-antigen/teichoic acid export membrane protein